LVNNGPGPFNQETVETFELGYKTQLGDRGWINAAIFNSKIEDMQREVNLADPVSVVVQIIKNTADATINGAEIDGGYSLTDSVFLSASIGWIDDEYDKVLFDISGDGTIDDLDLALELPRAADLTYNVSLSRDDNIGGWAVSSRISFSHRDESFYLDNNLGIVNEQDILDAGIDLYSGDGHWVVGIYGKNLTDEVKHGGDTQLPAMVGPAALGGTFSPLAKGRVMGAEVTYNF
jgi:iron complex outermembrane receptor protein